MKTSTYIWIGVGSLALYLCFSKRKRALTAAKTEAREESVAVASLPTDAVPLNSEAQFRNPVPTTLPF